MSRPPLARRFAARTAAVLAMGFVVIGLSACAQTVSLEPAESAADPACADIIVSLPVVLPSDADNQDIRQTDAQATAAWGSPASILLRCGIPPQGPTTLPCITINGIDWVEDDSNKPSYRYVTYGRVPTTEVIIDSSVVSGTSTLVDLGPVISKIPQTNKCLGAEDTLNIPTDAPSAG
ncbi:DUF3515 family protein [Agreia pratensis]|nr:DUF3515 family protein [Agreia pratensis]MBF4633465.1 DUF3515 family protein [Agreia pratensis]